MQILGLPVLILTQSVHLSGFPAKSLQSCLTLCDPMDSSPPGCPIRGDSPGKNTGVGCHFLLQGDLLDPGIEPVSLMSPALAGRFFTTRTT